MTLAQTELIKIVICRLSGITYEDFMSHSRKRELVVARYVCTGVYRFFGLSYPVIGLLLNRNYSSVINLCNRLDNALKARVGYEDVIQLLATTWKEVDTLVKNDPTRKIIRRKGLLAEGVIEKDFVNFGGLKGIKDSTDEI